MTRFIEWLKALIDRLQGIDAEPRTGMSGSVDAIALAADAVMTEASRHRTGSVLFLPDAVRLALPDQELAFWNPRSDTLQEQVAEQVARKARRAARRLGRTVEGGRVHVVLTASGSLNAAAVASFSDHPDDSDKDEDKTVNMAAAGGPAPTARSLQLHVDGSLTASTPLHVGVQIGRHLGCQLPVPSSHTSVSRHAATVQAVDGDGVRLLVTNSNGVWVADDDGRGRMMRRGSTLTLTTGQRLLLDADARTSVALS